MITSDNYQEIHDTLTRATELAKALSGKNFPTPDKPTASVPVEPSALKSTVIAPKTPQVIEHTLDQANQLSSLNFLMNAISEAIFVVNDEGVIEMINQHAAKLFGAPKELLIGQKWTNFVNSAYQEEYQDLFVHWRETFTPFNHGPKEIVLQRVDSSLVDADLSLSCLPVGEHAKPLIIGVMHNLTSHKEKFAELTRLANTDKLTNLANRHAFDEALENAWDDSRQHQHPLSLILIDIDFFKIFNDNYGHINGDKCLQKVAQAIAAAMPNRDCLAARFGGEEFTVILPNFSQAQAQRVAEKIQRQISQIKFTDMGLTNEVKVSVSQGIACEQKGQFRTATALICAADTALYRAKSEGRNRVSLSL
ncbi:sensor domain-containing diguanylate cyclase [Shewanella sp. OMA3-2]|uniref:sensor domain-containing diguanylate cyclase n=1 Tax=Shewanella sp. OMA3-2 TaxID=2908650 RepID=UPI001F24983B|nr:sensor domain-containing diguanylate cyclase [Shewanella sp. OMA3-2]UJF21644.1 sensor domain-containing diguanylate cyclase [Shewanella sp. OMA3-2]